MKNKIKLVKRAIIGDQKRWERVLLERNSENDFSFATPSAFLQAFTYFLLNLIKQRHFLALTFDGSHYSPESNEAHLVWKREIHENHWKSDLLRKIETKKSYN